MNSLAYLSRQFDVIAQPKTPPSTPTSERQSPLDHPLPRVKTWSTKSFLFSPHRVGPKRSYSSPADLISLARAAALSSSPPDPSSSMDSQSSPKSNLDSLLGRIFLVRVLVIAWDSLHSAWRSLLDTLGLFPLSLLPPPTHSSDLKVREANEDASNTSLHPPLPQVGRSQTDSVVPLDPPPLITDPVTVSRSSTPPVLPRKTPFHLPKTLVLDLDETLIHSTSRPMASGSSLFGLGPFGGPNKGSGHVVEVVLEGRSTVYHVYKRPFVDFFLRTVAGWYTLVIFTASMQEYADPVIDWLDAGRGILTHRFFRDSCTQLPNGSYTKDLAVVESDLARVCLVDNSPISYRINEANGIPIEGWTSDPSDEALLDLLPVLDSLRFTSDVRRVLGLRWAGGPP